LTTVQGVGARLALSLLSAVPPEKLGLAILAQDKPALAQAEGVGLRLAARIVNELRDKIGNVAAPMTAGSAALLTEAANGQGASADAIAALENLGVGRTEALGAIAAAARRLGSEAGADVLIKAGLEELAR
jgi:Holliday junction DNA helicase RuvA